MSTRSRILIQNGVIARLTLLFAIVGSISIGSTQVNAQSSPTLGTAISFAILAGSAITNTGSSNIFGNVGENEHCQPNDF